MEAGGNRVVRRIGPGYHYYVNARETGAEARFAQAFGELLHENRRSRRETVVVCIGSDRSTGDSLGPIIGYKLTHGGAPRSAAVYGTLEAPVHAKNLAEALAEIRASHQNPFVIAVDACLGAVEHVGRISLGRGCVRPGAGLNKTLPEVGDVYITGVVNGCSFPSLDYAALQSTRLAIVMRMADVIAAGMQEHIS